MEIKEERKAATTELVCKMRDALLMESTALGVTNPGEVLIAMVTLMGIVIDAYEDAYGREVSNTVANLLLKRRGRSLAHREPFRYKPGGAA